MIHYKTIRHKRPISETRRDIVYQIAMYNENEQVRLYAIWQQIKHEKKHYKKARSN